MSETIFTKIMRGEVPCHKIYEDEHVFAFLDIHPLSDGHTLVLPKEPAVTLDRLSDESSAAIGRALPRICRAVLAATGTTDFNLVQNNGHAAHQAVLHVHFHIIPRHADGSGVGLRWKPGSLDADHGRALAAKIAAAV